MHHQSNRLCLQILRWTLCLFVLTFHLSLGDLVGSVQRRHQYLSRSSRRAYQAEPSITGFERYYAATELLKVWSPTDYRVAYLDDLVERSFAITFYDYRIENFSRFVAVPKQSVIYAVGDGVKLIKLDATSLLFLDMYSLPPAKNNNVCQDNQSCQQAKEISLLALMPNREMIWFCYAQYLHRYHRLLRFVDSGCIVPTIGSLTESLLQWENPQFNSLDPRQPTITFNAADGFTYVAAMTLSHVQFFRARMPDWNGQVDWSGALTLDRRRGLITEPAEVLLIFETEDAVYFVLREQALHRFEGEPGGRSHSPLGFTYIDVSCLARVCKGDPGGSSRFNADKFSTFSKANLKCEAADDSGQRFAFTYLTAAHWDIERQELFATFTTEKLAPVGSALCVYSKNSIEAAFSGPVVSPTLSELPLSGQQPTSLLNEFPNICKRFSSKNLTSEELSLGRRLSLSFPSRYGTIEPAYNRALFTQSGQVWRQIALHTLPALAVHVNLGQSANVLIIWLASENTVLRLAVYEPQNSKKKKTTVFKSIGPVICKLNELRLGSNWPVLRRLHVPPEKKMDYQDVNLSSQINTSNVSSAWWPIDGSAERDLEVIRQIEVLHNELIILTSRQIIRQPLTDCSVYSTYEYCVQSRDPHCGWSWAEGRCRDGYAAIGGFGGSSQSNFTYWHNTFSPSVDRSKAMFRSNAVCPSDRHPLNTREKAWSDWYTCRWYITLNTHPNYDRQALDGDLRIKTNNGGRSVGRCQCRLCLTKSECRLGSQEVINCTSSDRNWLPWSGWSRCDLETRIQTRHRLCRPRATCAGSNREQRLCDPSSAWAGHYERLPIDPLAASALRLRRVDNSDRTPGSHEDYFTLSHMLLVALLCLVLGCLMTTVILFIYWHFCPEPSSSVCCHVQYPKQTLPTNRHNSKRTFDSLTVHATSEDVDKPNCIHTNRCEWTPDITSVSSRYPLIDHSSGGLKILNPEPVCRRPNTQSICTGRSKSTSFSGPPTASTLFNFTFDTVDTDVQLNEPVSPLDLADNAREQTLRALNNTTNVLMQVPVAMPHG